MGTLQKKVRELRVIKMAIAGMTRKHRKTQWIDTPFAFGMRGESTPISFRVVLSDSEVFAKSGLLEECLQLKMETTKLKAENISLKAKVVAMQATNSAERFQEFREIPRDQAKEEVRAFFKAHHGETIYPSDIMNTLSLDYNLVYEICEELEQEGEIKGL